MDHTALRFSVFLDLRCTNCHFCCCIISLSFASSTAGRTKLRIIDLIVIIPLIDRASNDDSNGCHIVIWSNLDLGIENPACRLDLQSADGFLALFLTPSFEQKSSNRADYTPNR